MRRITCLRRLWHSFHFYLPANTHFSGVPKFRKPLRYYLRNNFYATLSGVRRLSTVRCTLDEMGEDRVMFSVDYPFQSDQDASDWFDYVEGIGVQTKKKIAWENAKRLLSIEDVCEGWMEEEEFL
jgi:predicted TIM-barrel fold metal-dependent hydrolase